MHALDALGQLAILEGIDKAHHIGAVHAQDFTEGGLGGGIAISEAGENPVLPQVESLLQ